MSVSRKYRHGLQHFGDYVRRRHTQHFDECEATGTWSGIYTDYFYRDLEVHLIQTVKSLEIRAEDELTGAARERTLRRLEHRQDHETDRLVTFFLTSCGAEGSADIGFGHVAEGLMGITDARAWWQCLANFRDALWRWSLSSTPAFPP